MCFVIEPLDGGVLNGAVHPLDLAIGPGMLGLGGAVIYVAERASIFEDMGAEELAVGDGFLDERRGRSAGTRRREVDAIIGRHGVDLVGCSLDEPVQEVACGRVLGLLVQLDEGELAGPVIATNM